MKNFLNIAQGLDAMPLLLSVQRQPELWNEYNVRREEGDDILLRYNEFNEGDNWDEKVAGSVDVENYPAWALVPQARPIILGTFARVEGLRLGRVFLLRVNAGEEIAPSGPTDVESKIPPHLYYKRYMLSISGNQDSSVSCGTESVNMVPGSLWWVDHRQPISFDAAAPHDLILLSMEINHGDSIVAPSSVPR